MSNNNVIYSKTLELRSNNRGTVPLKASEVLEIKWEGGKESTNKGLGERKARQKAMEIWGFISLPKENPMHFVMICAQTEGSGGHPTCPVGMFMEVSPCLCLTLLLFLISPLFFFPNFPPLCVAYLNI